MKTTQIELSLPIPLINLHLDESQIAEFWSLVEKTEDCWLWRGRVNEDGYGLFCRGSINEKRGQTYLAHKIAYELTVGPVPDGKCVLHRCDVPPCVRPSHLWTGTRAENNSDRHLKGRSATGISSGAHTMPWTILKGEHNGRHKLTAAQVREIFLRYRTGGVSQRDLAAEFGTSHNSIGDILRRVTWTEVTGDL